MISLRAFGGVLVLVGLVIIAFEVPVWLFTAALFIVVGAVLWRLGENP